MSIESSHRVVRTPVGVPLTFPTAARGSGLGQEDPFGLPRPEYERHLLEGQQLVCVSVMDWDWPFWTSRQHLMTQFALRNQVLFVDPPPTFARDYLDGWRNARLRRKLVAWARNGGLSSRSGGITVWSPPPAIPFNRVGSRAAFQRLLAFNQWNFRQALRRTLDRVGFRDPILWVSFNVYFGDAVVGQIGEKLSVYHCTDEISGFPGYSPFISEIEGRLAARSDLVLASSQVLRDAKARHNPNSYFVPNGADVDLFQRALSWDGPLPEDLLRLPEPRAGFVGQVEYRFDCDLLRYAARQMPSWSFVLIGPVQEGNREVDALRSLPNVHFLGLKERISLPGYLASLNVALIPYKINRLTQGIYPLKLNEYLAAGKPVVATPLPSLRETPGVVYLGGDGPSFVDALERAAREDNPDHRKARSDLARNHGWPARAAEISAVLAGGLEAKGHGAANRGPTAGHQGWESRHPSLASFLGMGRDLSHRHSWSVKRLAYRLLGDLNAHRRVRAAYVVGVLKGLRISEAEILDAGCGEGACTVALARQLTDCRVIGVDIDEDSIATCRRVATASAADNLRFEWGDVSDLPFVGRFDAAVCVDVLEHVAEDERALAGIYRALKPGGRLVVHVPMRHQLQRRFLPTHKGHHVSDHVRDEYSREEIVEKVAGAGFRIDSLQATFGAAGELAFELNTLFARVPWLREITVALTYPLVLFLSYLEVVCPRRGGNSFLIVASKPDADSRAGRMRFGTRGDFDRRRNRTQRAVV